MKQGDHYIRRDDPDGVVEVRGTCDGAVEYVPAGGGFVHRSPLAKFDGDFRPETPEDRERHRAFRKAAVVGDWAEDQTPIPAWLNNANWNGFAVPAFERQDAIDAIAAGRILDTHYHEAADVFIFLDNYGEPIPPFDPEELFARIMVAAEDPDFHEIDVAGQTIEVDIFRGSELKVADGSEVLVFHIGSGSWTWARADGPAPGHAGSPAP